MAPTLPKNSVWTAMSYTPPRGRCGHKTGLMSPVCPCLRFMLHPVKAATSFECDGCGHHASFHAMENKEEEEVVRRWEVDGAGGQAGAGAGRKRKRIENGQRVERGSVVLQDGADVSEVLEIEDGHSDDNPLLLTLANALSAKATPSNTLEASKEIGRRAKK